MYYGDDASSASCRVSHSASSASFPRATRHPAPAVTAKWRLLIGRRTERDRPVPRRCRTWPFRARAGAPDLADPALLALALVGVGSALGVVAIVHGNAGLGHGCRCRCLEIGVGFTAVAQPGRVVIEVAVKRRDMAFDTRQ